VAFLFLRYAQSRVTNRIVVLDLQRSFGSLRAVDGLSFSVAAGEIYGLLGPNGAGKTTALRILAGLLKPDGGHAQVDGIPVGPDPIEIRRRIGFLTGSAGLYGRLSARELLRYTASLYGVPANRIEARIAKLSESLGLESLLDRRCEGLSTGQKQRVSIARALVHDPGVLILDEPTTGLDVIASQGLRDAISAERARGKAIVLSTHYLAEAELLCDRVGFMHEGRLIREGTPTSLRAETGALSLEAAFLSAVGVTSSLSGTATP